MKLTDMRSLVLKVLGVLLLPVILASQVLAAEGPSLSGFVDFGYNYNFNNKLANVLRTFDANANSFTLQNTEIVLSGKSDGDVAYRVDVDYGFDASVIHSAGFGIAGQIDLQQAFISVPCEWTKGTVTLGKFVTPFGAEVIEAKDNFNTSRGLLFNYAIPFTHTGIKWDKSWADNQWTTGLGLVNGWDNLQDNNKGKTWLATLGWNPVEKFAWTVGLAYGPEQSVATPSIEKNGRGLFDTVVKFVPTDRLTLVANYDWGTEEGLANVTSGLVGTEKWSGLGLHANFAFSENCSAALRFENFDDSGSRTGTEQVLTSYTATLQHKHNDITGRIEFRHDNSSDKVFVKNNGTTTKGQDTIGIQWIYSF